MALGHLSKIQHTRTRSCARPQLTKIISVFLKMYDYYVREEAQQ